MRIAIDCRRIIPEMSGLGTYTLELVQALSFLCEKTGDELLLFMLPESLHRVQPAGDNTQLIPVKYPVEDHLRGDWWKNISLPGLLRKLHCDVFHDPAYQVPLRTISSRCIVTVHDLAPFRFPGTNTWKYNLYWRFMTRQTMKRADHVVTVSEFVKQELIQHFPEHKSKISVVYEAASNCFSPGLPDVATLEKFNINQNYLLTTAKYEPRKNLARAVEAFAGVCETLAGDVQLVIAGGMGWKTTDIQDALQKAGIRHRVVLTGYVSRLELVTLLRGALALVVPSLYEGFGLPVLEAMATGTPVLCARAASLPEIAGESVLYFDPENVSSIISAMVKLIQSETLREKLSREGLDRATMFTWEKAAEETLKVYRRGASQGEE